jgi:hypothetical protein
MGASLTISSIGGTLSSIARDIGSPLPPLSALRGLFRARYRKPQRASIQTLSLGASSKRQVDRRLRGQSRHRLFAPRN